MSESSSTSRRRRPRQQQGRRRPPGPSPGRCARLPLHARPPAPPRRCGADLAAHGGRWPRPPPPSRTPGAGLDIHPCNPVAREDLRGEGVLSVLCQFAGPHRRSVANVGPDEEQKNDNFSSLHVASDMHHRSSPKHPRQDPHLARVPFCRSRSISVDPRSV